jgi:hypothetical protein
MLGEALARAPVRASPSMVSECLAPYGTSLAELTIGQQRRYETVVCLFITRSGRPALASVPDTINCRILISEYVHVYIISSRCRNHRGPTAAISIFP